MVFITQEFLLLTQELIHFTQEILPLLPKKLRTPYSRNLRVPSYQQVLLLESILTRILGVKVHFPLLESAKAMT